MTTIEQKLERNCNKTTIGQEYTYLLAFMCFVRGHIDLCKLSGLEILTKFNAIYPAKGTIEADHNVTNCKQLKCERCIWNEKIVQVMLGHEIPIITLEEAVFSSYVADEKHLFTIELLNDAKIISDELIQHFFDNVLPNLSKELISALYDLSAKRSVISTLSTKALSDIFSSRLLLEACISLDMMKELLINCREYRPVLTYQEGESPFGESIRSSLKLEAYTPSKSAVTVRLDSQDGFRKRWSLLDRLSEKHNRFQSYVSKIDGIDDALSKLKNLCDGKAIDKEGRISPLFTDEQRAISPCLIAGNIERSGDYLYANATNQCAFMKSNFLELFLSTAFTHGLISSYSLYVTTIERFKYARYVPLDVYLTMIDLFAPSSILNAFADDCGMLLASGIKEIKQYTGICFDNAGSVKDTMEFIKADYSLISFPSYMAYNHSPVYDFILLTISAPYELVNIDIIYNVLIPDDYTGEMNDYFKTIKDLIDFVCLTPTNWVPSVIKLITKLWKNLKYEGYFCVLMSDYAGLINTHNELLKIMNDSIGENSYQGILTFIRASKITKVRCWKKTRNAVKAQIKVEQKQTPIVKRRIIM